MIILEITCMREEINGENYPVTIVLLNGVWRGISEREGFGLWYLDRDDLKIILDSIVAQNPNQELHTAYEQYSV